MIISICASQLFKNVKIFFQTSLGPFAVHDLHASLSKSDSVVCFLSSTWLAKCCWLTLLNLTQKCPRRDVSGEGDTSSSANTKDYSAHPSYVEYQGTFYHIAEFLSLQQGKVYRPSTSRNARWILSSRDDFYEKIEKTVTPSRTENGVYLGQYAAFWLDKDELQIGKIVRLFHNPRVKSAFPIFHWTKNSSSQKVTAVINVAQVANKEDSAWSLSLKRFLWCPTYDI